MRKFVLASVSALALFGVAACSDSGQDNSTTQSTTPPPADAPTTQTPQANPPADNGSGGSAAQPTQPPPAPAQ